MALLDEIRVRARETRQRFYREKADKPNELQYADMIVKLYSNEDYIKAAPRSLIYQTLFSVGYPVKEIKDLYEQLLEEVNRTYPAVSPEMFAKIMKEKEKTDSQ